MVGPIEASNGFYVLGDTFIRNFYTTFDYDELTVSLAAATHLPKYGNIISGWDLFGIIFGCFAGVVLITILTVCIYRKYCKKDESEDLVY